MRFAAHLTDSGEASIHTLGAVYDRERSLATWLRLAQADAGSYRTEPIAVLGDSLALLLQWSSAAGIATAKFDVGPYATETVLLIEVDEQRRRRRTEVFGTHHLGDAVARLYERYAELLPDGPERARAAGTARSLAAATGPLDPDRYAAAFAPAIESIDHRILGNFFAQGASSLVQQFRSWIGLAEGTNVRADEIIGLTSDALLVRRTFSGTDREGGGAFERQFLLLWVFGTDGLVTRFEWFDVDREADALARFDEVAAAPTPVRPARRVRANAATAIAGPRRCRVRCPRRRGLFCAAR